MEKDEHTHITVPTLQMFEHALLGDILAVGSPSRASVPLTVRTCCNLAVPAAFHGASTVSLATVMNVIDEHQEMLTLLSDAFCCTCMCITKGRDGADPCHAMSTAEKPHWRAAALCVIATKSKTRQHNYGDMAGGADS